MLKYILTLGVLSLIPIILAQSQESVSESEETVNHPSRFLFKIYPTRSLQVEFLRKYAIASGQSNGPASTRAQIIKTGYALVPISSRMDFIEMLRRKNIKSLLVEITTINSVVVDNLIYESSKFEPQNNGSAIRNDSFGVRLRLRVGLGLRVRLVNVATSFCLNSAFDPVVGSRVVVTSTCNVGNDQQWLRSGDRGIYTIFNVGTSKCLDGIDGQVSIAKCNGGSFQKWTGGTEIKNRGSSKCLDSNSNNDVYLKDCNNGNNQKWHSE